MTAQPRIFCEPTEQTWWSQRCAGCDHPLLAHKTETLVLDGDGQVVVLPTGEAVEMQPEWTKAERSICTTCNLLAAIGDLTGSIANFSNVMAQFGDDIKKAHDRMDQAGLPQYQAPEPPSIGDTH